MSLVDQVKAASEEYDDVLWELGIDVDSPIHTERHGPRRWSELVTNVYEHEGKFYALQTDDPLTEMQEGMDRFVDFFEVEPKERVVTVVDYVRKSK